MKENRFSEKESLELITKMIQQTKQNLQVGSGNILLHYGYTAILISLVVYLLCRFTGEMYWHNLWFLMFVPMVIEKISSKRRPEPVVTYIDKAVTNVWGVINALFVVSVLTILLIGFLTKVIPFILMMPLALLYVGIGTACTGVLTNDKSITYFPLVSFVISIYMLVTLFTTRMFTIEWNLLGGLAFLTMLVIPGHLLNYKSQKQCSKN